MAQLTVKEAQAIKDAARKAYNARHAAIVAAITIYGRGSAEHHAAIVRAS